MASRPRFADECRSQRERGSGRPQAGCTRCLAAGQARYSQIRAAVDEVIARAYEDLPVGDLATAARVLTLVTVRLNAELADG
jgi:hypothetical protein